MIVCSPQLGISPESNLGGEVYDREILKSLDELGVTTLIILPWGKKYPPLKRAKFYFLPTPFVYPPWLFNLLILPYLLYLYSKYKFDILRVHSPYFVGPAAILFSLLNQKVKVIPSYLHLENNNIYNFVDRLLLPHYYKIIAISQSTKQDLINDFQVPPERIKVIPCGVDEKYRPKGRNDELIESLNLKNKKILLYLGQLIRRKNIPFLFEVLKYLPSKFVLLLCGDGPFKKELEETVKTMGLSDRVVFTGRIRESDKVDYYNLADVFVYPSLNEGFGLSVYEALACGKRVIASDIPVFKEVKSRGIVLLPLDAPTWVRAILEIDIKVFNLKTDYSWAKTAKKLYELYQGQ